MLAILILQKNIQKEFKKLKKIAEKPDFDGIEFPIQEKDFSKIEVKNNTCINVFGYENGLVFLYQIMCKLKILTDLCFRKQKIKTKSGFVEVLYSVLVVKVCI